MYWNRTGGKFSPICHAWLPLTHCCVSETLPPSSHPAPSLPSQLCLYSLSSSSSYIGVISGVTLRSRPLPYAGIRFGQACGKKPPERSTFLFLLSKTANNLFLWAIIFLTEGKHHPSLSVCLVPNDCMYMKFSHIMTRLYTHTTKKIKALSIVLL